MHQAIALFAPGSARQGGSRRLGDGSFLQPGKRQLGSGGQQHILRLRPHFGLEPFRNTVRYGFHSLLRDLCRRLGKGDGGVDGGTIGDQGQVVELLRTLVALMITRADIERLIAALRSADPAPRRMAAGVVTL